MRAASQAYLHPAKWGQKSTDTNIDHRRVPNLDTFFRRHGTSITPTPRAEDFSPGDIVVWLLPYGLPHIGIVSDRISPTGAPLVIHNIASGVEMAAVLFEFTITGHYRYLSGSAAKNNFLIVTFQGRPAWSSGDLKTGMNIG